MTDGTEVRIRGRLDWYAPRGQLQLRMTAIDPAYTLGQLEVARAELLARLDAEGLLRANARACRCRWCRCGSGLVTSARQRRGGRLRPRARGAAASRSTSCGSTSASRVSTHRSRWWPPSREAAAAGVDVVALVRGGGAAHRPRRPSTTSAWRGPSPLCPVPVLTGIGHEVDRSVADEVAHRSREDADRLRARARRHSCACSTAVLARPVGARSPSRRPRGVAGHGRPRRGRRRPGRAAPPRAGLRTAAAPARRPRRPRAAGGPRPPARRGPRRRRPRPPPAPPRAPCAGRGGARARVARGQGAGPRPRSHARPRLVDHPAGRRLRGALPG